jgi:plastocyanin
MNTRVGVAYIILGISTAIISAGIFFTADGAEARTEQLSDTSNNNLMISMEAPDFWNSGIISQTVSSLDWRLNGLDAMNDNMGAFFIVVNTPSVVNMALPLGQKTGILSLLLSQYVTINAESDLTLSDGSAAHRYSISITPAQLHRLNAPIDKGFDGIIITTKQQSTTYFIIYASELGKMSQFESVFQNILNSVKFGSVTFSGASAPLDNAVPGNNAPILQNDKTKNNIGGPMMENAPSGPVAQDSTIMVGNPTGASAGASVTISPGSSDPDNGKFFIPDTLVVSKGTTATWANDDSVVHTVTSGKSGKNAGVEFDSSYLDVGQTFQHTFDTAGTFPYYCTLHPFMKGKIIVS